MPQAVDSAAGGPTRLEHRYLSTDKHILICQTANGAHWAYLEDRSNANDITVLQARKSDGGYSASTTGSTVSVSWSNGLSITGARPLKEPVVLERSGSPGRESERAR